MDFRHFDALSRALSGVSSRRSVLALLTTIPVFGGLLSNLSPEEAESAGRRRRRKKRHKHGKGRRRGKSRKSRCSGKALARVCAGRPCGASDRCGGTCQCPAGQNCCIGTCSECACGQTRLSNGTCVSPCTSDSECCAVCMNWQENPVVRYCAAGDFPESCSTSGDEACPEGTFCSQVGFCTTACS